MVTDQGGEKPQHSGARGERLHQVNKTLNEEGGTEKNRKLPDLSQGQNEKTRDRSLKKKSVPKSHVGEKSKKLSKRGT